MSGLNLWEEVFSRCWSVGERATRKSGDISLSHNSFKCALNHQIRLKSWISFHFVADLHGVWGCRIILDSNPCFFLNDYFLFLAQVLQ